MSEKKVVNALVSGGEASAGPPLGPALGPLGINILQVVNTINEKTKDFPGMKVPVKVEVDSDTKKFTVEVGFTPTAALIFI
jgi:large subunit ribosomal protein L11